MTSTQNDAGLHFTTNPLEFTYHPGPIEFTALEDSYLFALEDSYLSALPLLLLPSKHGWWLIRARLVVDQNTVGG